jgi:hypothetical protein
MSAHAASDAPRQRKRTGCGRRVGQLRQLLGQRALALARGRHGGGKAERAWRRAGEPLARKRLGHVTCRAAHAKRRLLSGSSAKEARRYALRRATPL